MGSLGVRKGAWNKLEDDLLRACVEQYGEGKWHLVAKRAGLNRCRKSCRLRWLNYLDPKINRGEFKEDEIDLIIRLHKLLGNRWALIAGRLPGRTPNDIKNYWNSYIRKNHYSHKERVNTMPKETIIEPHVVIKPQARTISKTSPWLRGKSIRENQSGDKKCATNEACVAGSSEFNNNCWNTLVEEKGCIDEYNTCLLGEEDKTLLLEDLNWDDEIFSLTTNEIEDFLMEGQTWSDVLGTMNTPMTTTLM